MDSHQRRIIRRAFKQAGLALPEEQKPMSGKHQTSSLPEHKVLPKEWRLWLWAAAMAIALFLLAPLLGGNRARVLVAICLLAFAILLILPLRHMPWILETTKKQKRSRTITGVVLCLGLTAMLGWLTWPASTKRHLSRGDIATFSGRLRQQPETIQIVAIANDSEAYDLAEQFVLAFGEAEWNVEPKYPLTAIVMGRPGQLGIGITVLCRPEKEGNAKNIQAALKSIDMKSDLVCESNNITALELRVDPKPED